MNKPDQKGESENEAPFFVWGERSAAGTICGSRSGTGFGHAHQRRGRKALSRQTLVFALRGAEPSDAAEQVNEPGRFTAFIGYEWTSNTGGNNLHRNLIFRDGGDKASQVVPFTVYLPFGSDNPEDLWNWMKAYEDKTGGSVLAIAHNGNLSNGLMFPVIEAFGEKIDNDYAKKRTKWERLYEVTQTKGTGEAHPYLSPNDEFADFELCDKGNLDGSAAKKSMLEFEYARSAFRNGLKLARELGTNPYQFGLVGSSDAHTGLTTMQEDNFFGKTTPQEPNPERMLATFLDNPQTGIKFMDWEVGASGYAAVWATENTRASIWDAIQRKETYATTGPRMIVRLFGGWNFDPSEPAFYYGPVLEIPTPRWTTYDAKFYGTEPLRGTVMTLQDRAYTCPIGYTPKI